MKLDRNINRGGRGKYALVNMRKLIPILDKHEDKTEFKDATIEGAVWGAFKLLVEQGIISLGNETPGDQFFVMKYKDKFTANGLHAYATMAFAEAEKNEDIELKEYAGQMFDEAQAAYKLGNRIPD